MGAEDTMDDDAEMDRWMRLTDEQQDKEVEAACREHDEWWNTLDWRQQYAVRRRSLLGTCAGWRRTIAKMDMPVFRKHLKRCQMLLADARAQRYGRLSGGTA